MELIINELKYLIESQKLSIKDTIEIDDINKLIILSESNNPIPIKYYSKNLVHVKGNNICICCNKVAVYKSNNSYYCWTHSHSLT